MFILTQGTYRAVGIAKQTTIVDLIETYTATTSFNLIRREVWAWALLAVCSLAIAGVFALFVALSRVPGITEIFPWPQELFHNGLVIHVVFSFVIWFLAVFALITCLACSQIMANNKIQLLWVGRAGILMTAISFPLLFVPAFFPHAEAILSNYVPVIDHSFYKAGLVLFFAGVLMPVIRLIANFPFRPPGSLDQLSFASLFGSGIYLVALICMSFVATQASTDSSITWEQIFWGGGHVLQFLNTLVMLCGWILLARISGQEVIFDKDIFRLASILLLVFSTPALLFYARLNLFSDRLNEAFVSLQYAHALPVALMGGSGLIGFLHRWRISRKLVWSSPVFLCLVMSFAVFGIGGFMGFAVDGADTRTPAHYHGVIAGVNLAIMGLFLFFFLPVLGRKTGSNRSLTILILLFGFGQMLACVGLFLAGGYGAPRKAPGNSFDVLDGAVVSMYLNGVGAIIAVVGGAMFIWCSGSALLRSRTP